MKWISVSDRLPEKYESDRALSDYTCVVRPEYPRIEICYWSGQKWLFEYYEGSIETAPDNYVTHWIELPPFPPPKDK